MLNVRFVTKQKSSCYEYAVMRYQATIQSSQENCLFIRTVTVMGEFIVSDTRASSQQHHEMDGE